MFFLPCQSPVDPGRQPQKPRHRPEGQLQADRFDRKWIVHQNQKQRRQHCRRRVALPAEQGRRRQKAEHHAGPHHRGRRPGEGRIENQHRNGRCRSQTPPVLSREKAHQRQQIGTVHAADRQNVVDARFRKVHVRLNGQFPLPPRQQGQQKACVVPVKEGSDSLLHGAAQPGGPPPDGVRISLAEGRRSPAVSQQEHALGVEHRYIVIPDAGGALQIHVIRDPLARAQLQKGCVPVIGQPSRQALRLHRRLCTEAGLGGILRQGHGQGPLAIRQGLHGFADLPDIQPVPPQRQRRAHQTEDRPFPPTFRQKQRPKAQCKAHQATGQQPAARQQILRQKDPCGKPAAEQRQPSHLTGYGSGRSVRPSR